MLKFSTTTCDKFLQNVFRQARRKFKRCEFFRVDSKKIDMEKIATKKKKMESWTNYIQGNDLAIKRESEMEYWWRCFPHAVEWIRQEADGLTIHAQTSKLNRTNSWSTAFYLCHMRYMHRWFFWTKQTNCLCTYTAWISFFIKLKTTNLISCRVCGVQYIGETRTTLKRRFYGHRSTVKTQKLDTPVGHHFNLPNHSISDMILQGIEALGNHRETVRLSREKLWIRRLQTIQPHGLNIQEGND